MDNLKTRENFIIILEHYGLEFDPNKNQQNIKCPIHDDRNPSLSIRLDECIFNCFAGCGQGDMFEFVAMMEGLDCKTEFSKVLAKAKEILGIKEEAEKKELIARYNYVVDGVVINTKYKYAPESRKPYGWKILKDQGGQFPIYNVDALRNATEIVLAEGEKDAGFTSGGEFLRFNVLTL